MEGRPLLLLDVDFFEESEERERVTGMGARRAGAGALPSLAPNARTEELPRVDGALAAAVVESDFSGVEGVGLTSGGRSSSACASALMIAWASVS